MAPKRRARNPGAHRHLRAEHEEKSLARLTKRVATLHLVANDCLREARGSAAFIEAAPELRPPDPHAARRHDPELARAIENMAATLEGLSGIEGRWKGLAHKADDLAGEIIDVKRADLERVLAVDHAESELRRLAASHDERLHPKKE